MGSMSPVPHPFDPLSVAEIEASISLVKKAHGDVFFNVVSLHEPRKAEMTAWLADPEKATKPARVADVVVIASGGKVYDGLVDLEAGKIMQWELLEGVQPIVSPCSAPVHCTSESFMKPTTSHYHADHARGTYGG